MNFYESVCLKIERAKTHVHNLDALIGKFGQQNPYRLVGNLDPNTGDSIFRFAKVAPLPSDIPLIVGDAIHNLRSALDHIAWALFERYKTDPKVKRREVFFPVWQSKQVCEAELARKVKMFGQKAVDAIAKAHPYKGGNQTLWYLHELNLADKHRLIVAIVAQAGMDITPFVEDGFARLAKMSGLPTTSVPQFKRRLVIPAGVGMVAAKEGDVAFTVPAGKVIDLNRKIPMVIAFDEPEITGRQSVMLVLDSMVNAVEGIAKQFESLI